MKRTIFAFAVACFALATLAAQEGGLSFSLGAGAFLSNTYVGSEDYAAAVMPIATVEYAAGPVSFSASVMDGLSVGYVNVDRRFFGSLSANFGEERNRKTYSAGFFPADHRDEIAARLAGTPNVSTAAYTELMLGYISPVGLLGTIIGYHPTDSEGADGNDRFHHGLLASAFLLLPVPVTDRLSVTAMLAVSVMNSSYSDAWYSVPETAAELEPFNAEAGLRDFQFFLQAEYLLTERFGVSFMVANLWLLGDAEKSPYTNAGYQLSSGLYSFLKF